MSSNIENIEIPEDELERYNFLMEASKEMYPGVCHWYIHTCVLEQIQEEKGIFPDEQNIEELRMKYDNNLDLADSGLISIKNFDDES